MKKLAQIFVGVDVSKEHLDVHLYPEKKQSRMKNSKEGICGLIRLLSGYSINQIIVESTGGYKQHFVKLCKEAGYSVWLVNPRRIRVFIFSEGVMAKTDKTDAQMIALFAAKKQNDRDTFDRSLISSNNRTLQNFIRRREDLVLMISTEKQRVLHPSQQSCREGIEEHILFLKKQLALIEARIEEVVCSDEELLMKRRILTSVPGVGVTIANIHLAEMPELGYVSSQKIAALLGVAPIVRQSGLSKGVATIQAGRKSVRRSFYMAALVATKHNPRMRELYTGLK